MSKAQRTAVVVGAGIGGMATAIRLAKQGFSVTVLEANAYPGGKLSQFQIDGYRFDAGPSLFTMPERVEELFSLAGQDIKQHFRYQRLDHVCHYFYENGKRLVAHAQPAQLAQDMQRELGEPADNVTKYLAQAARKYELVGGLFLHRSLHKVSTFLTPEAFKAYPQMPMLGLMNTMAQENAAAFKTPEAQQLFNRYATYNGSDPYQTPGLLTLIPHLECNMGAYFPEGGMINITNAVHALATRLGITFQFNTPVLEIIHSDGGSARAMGVRTAAGFMAADIVVSNLDIHPTYHRLLPKLPKPQRVLKQQRSSSALIFYWGINRTFQELGLHNIFFAQDYRAEFNALFQTKTLHPDPTVYINITSKYAPADAPAGCENWFTMINMPHDVGQDWSTLVPAAKTAIIQKLSRMLGTDIGQHIVCEQVLDPPTIEQRTGSYQGSLYGNSSNSKWAAFLRHNNKHKQVKGLYFVGGSVHPGGGIPLALSSAQIVADLVQEDFA